MRQPSLLLVLFLSISVPLLAQQAQDPNQATNQDANQATTQNHMSITGGKVTALPPATASIAGTVYCHDTHRPARGAIVMAQTVAKTGKANVNGGGGMGRVGLDGTFTVEHLPPGEYTIIAVLPGYLSPLDDVQLDGDHQEEDVMHEAIAHNGSVTVRANETGRMDVTLDRGGSVSGRVMYSDGSPATQVIIAVEDVNAKPPASKPNEPSVNAGMIIRGYLMHQSQGTDDQGRFHISGLKPGTYRVAAIHPSDNMSLGPFDGGMLFGATGDGRDVHVYAGDTLHQSAARTYDLRAGDDTSGVDITIPIEAFHRVRGRVSALDDTAINSAQLALTDSTDKTFTLRTSIAHDGSFVFSTVPTGNYTLSITNAFSGTPQANLPDNFPVDPNMLQNKRGFADSATAIQVLDTDLSGVNIHLTEHSDKASPAPPQ